MPRRCLFLFVRVVCLMRPKTLSISTTSVASSNRPSRGTIVFKLWRSPDTQRSAFSTRLYPIIVSLSSLIVFSPSFSSLFVVGHGEMLWLSIAFSDFQTRPAYDDWDNMMVSFDATFPFFFHLPTSALAVISLHLPSVCLLSQQLHPKSFLIIFRNGSPKNRKRWHWDDLHNSCPSQQHEKTHASSQAPTSHWKGKRKPTHQKTKTLKEKRPSTNTSKTLILCCTITIHLSFALSNQSHFSQVPEQSEGTR